MELFWGTATGFSLWLPKYGHAFCLSGSRRADSLRSPVPGLYSRKAENTLCLVVLVVAW